MEHLPPVEAAQSISVTIPVKPYLLDHCFEGRSVFPAVEAMQLLADTVRQNLPYAATDQICQADFPKFLVIDPAASGIPCLAEITAQADDLVQARLVTRIKSRKMGISRSIIHVTLFFAQQCKAADAPPQPASLTDLSSRRVTLPANWVYREMVPFRRAYHNLQGDLTVSANGVLADLSAPDQGAPTDPLGSPFPLDAAFHAACVWCQCYLGFIGFPIGFAKRIIRQPTRTGRTYRTRVIPVAIHADKLVCDLWIFDRKGNPYESVSGLIMRDVSAGRRRPPAWVADLIPVEEKKKLWF